MIGFLRGECLEVLPQQVVLGIGPQGDGLPAGVPSVVGYAVNVPGRSAYTKIKTGERVSLWIYTHVREDQLDLFGFQSRFEKDFFLTLMSVNGIGPKLALQILSAIEPDQIADAILRGDKEALTDLPGVGDKTAARMILELKKKMSQLVEEGQLTRARAQPAAGAQAAPLAPELAGGAFTEARQALLGLGFKEAEIARVLESAAAQGEAEVRTEDVIKLALRGLA